MKINLGELAGKFFILVLLILCLASGSATLLFYTSILAWISILYAYAIAFGAPLSIQLNTIEQHGDDKESFEDANKFTLAVTILYVTAMALLGLYWMLGFYLVVRLFMQGLMYKAMNGEFIGPDFKFQKTGVKIK